ncbi:hypothetical protein [Carnimonas nigrificans]|uniref:hypothetical protein n=1 Tax=Carnimonas nigrificans TaxID=64323 RepID=UPI00046F2A03|nr:hypothetical protein [Carnimonas nigrificans]
MSRFIRTLLGVAAMLCTTTLVPQVAQADEMIAVPYRDVLAVPLAKEKLSPAVRLYFGDQLYPQPDKEEGGFYFTRRVNKAFKSGEEACRGAALEALTDLQKRANDIGANAVTHISSYYSKQLRSDDSLDCHVGMFTVEVTLKGKLAIISG